MGTPSATNPVFPPIPANSVVLAAVYVPATDTAITSNQTVDKRVIVDFAPTSFVFITNVTGAGTITGKTYEANTVPANKVLTAFTSDDDSITVALEIHAAIDSWMPDSVTVSGGGATPVTSLRQAWTLPLPRLLEQGPDSG